MVALASAFVRVRPQLDKGEFAKAGQQGGEEAGKSFGPGFTRGSDGKLRDSRGKFVKDSEAAGLAGGGKAGESFGKSFGKGSGKAFDSLKSNLKLAAGVFVPLGLAGAVAEIGKIGIAYENNLNIFKVVTKATGEQMGAVAAKARALGSDITLPGVSAAGAADAMTELAKAGFTVQQSMDAAKGTLQLARIANIGEGQAAEIAANAVNAFGIEAKDTTFVVDELAAAANSSSIEISDASDAFKQAAAVFSGLQGPAVGGKEAITELNTAIAVLGNNGIKGQDAGTSLKQALLQLTGPSNAAKDAMRLLAVNAQGAAIGQGELDGVLRGGKKQREDALASIQKMNPGLKNQGDIAYDAAGKMRPLRDIIALTAAGTKGLTQEQKNQALTTIFGSDATRSILALIKGGLPVYDAQRTAILQTGAAAQVAAAQNAGLGGAIDNVKSQFENAAISIYNAVKGPLTTGLNGLASVLPVIFNDIGAFATLISDNIDVLRDWALAIGAVTLALKINSAMLAITAAGGLVKYIQGVSLVTKATQAWEAAQVLLDATLVANPIGAVIVAVVALVAGIILLYRHNETFRKIVQAVWSAIKTAISATVDWIVNVAWPAIVTAWQAIAAAALWLWHNVLEPVWHGIQAVIGFVVGAVRAYIAAIIAEFKFVAGVALWLWHNIFEPVFAGIKKVVEIWWLATEIILKLFSIAVHAVVGAAVSFLKTVFTAVFNYIRDYVVIPWWNVIKAIFNAFRAYVVGPVLATIEFLRALFVRIFNAIANTVVGWYRNYIAPIFAAVRSAWNTLALGFSIIYNTKIKPMFEAFIGFIRDKVVGGFKTGVALIAKAWSAVQDAAKRPVSFVVNHVINPFINGLNRAASIVGVKDRVEPIKGFAGGGKISGAGGITDNRQAVIPGMGAVQLQGGEFIVNRNDTAKALPLLRWVNNGMKGGADTAASYIGRPLTDMPGDGSEGWAFKGGGLIGWISDVWNAVSHPLDTIKKPFESALGAIPGGGLIKDFLVGSARSLLNGAVSWITDRAGGKGVASAVKFLHAQDGKPYIWADAGPAGYDCSGIVSAVYNIMHGHNPYSHTFSTDSAGQFFPKRGPNGPMAAAWSHPGQAPASASVGHMMGRVGNLNFESSGSRGVHLGSSTRNLSDFANIGHYRDGGLFGEPIRLFDRGGMWPSGTLGANMSGRTEYVDPSGRGGSRTYQITVNVAPGGHPVEVGRQTVIAIQAFENANGAGWRKP
jgi:TP901 family phage tail tape measure protein